MSVYGIQWNEKLNFYKLSFEGLQRFDKFASLLGDTFLKN